MTSKPPDGHLSPDPEVPTALLISPARLNGEFGIFAKAGAAGVFCADALIGPRLPSLTYMLGFPDVAALEAGWDEFSADPDWKKLSSDPQFKLHPPTVSNITSIVLRPLACSQV